MANKIIHSLAVHIDGLFDEVPRVDAGWWCRRINCRRKSSGCSAALFSLINLPVGGAEGLAVQGTHVAGLRLDTKLAKLLGWRGVHVEPIDIAEIPVWHSVGDSRFDSLHKLMTEGPCYRPLTVLLY